MNSKSKSFLFRLGAMSFLSAAVVCAAQAKQTEVVTNDTIEYNLTGNYLAAAKTGATYLIVQTDGLIKEKILDIGTVEEKVGNLGYDENGENVSAAYATDLNTYSTDAQLEGQFSDSYGQLEDFFAYAEQGLKIKEINSIQEYTARLLTGNTETEEGTENVKETETVSETEAVKKPEEEKKAETQMAIEATTEKLFGSCFITNDALITEYLNVREIPEGEVIGLLYPSTGGVVNEVDGEWVNITSGNCTGWVNMKYVLTGTAIAKSGEAISVIVDADPLFVRSLPDQDSEPVDTLGLGATVCYDNYTADWVEVSYRDMHGYVSADFVHLSIGDNIGLTLAEKANIEAAAEKAAAEAAAAEAAAAEQAAAEKAAAEAAAAAQAAAAAEQAAAAQAAADAQAALDAAAAQAAAEAAAQAAAAQSADAQVRSQIDAYAALGRSTMPVMYMSQSDIYLLSCVIMMEAGNESYDGMLAVAGVVLNRIRSGIWGSTLSEVIYAPGQFTGANTGLLASYLSSGPNAESVRAAYEACAGIHNIGGYLFFCSTRSARFDQYSSYYVINNQTFYAKNW